MPSSRRRLIADVTEMHEIQAGVRETSQAQAPRIVQKSRSALIMVAGLSKNEAEISERTEHLLGLVDETEYGIALPTTLRILSREMRSIEAWLKEGTSPRGRSASRPALKKTCLASRRRSAGFPHDSAPARHAPSADVRERERELNRLIAELKMVRMIQARLNDDTVGRRQDPPTRSAGSARRQARH